MSLRQRYLALLVWAGLTLPLAASERTLLVVGEHAPPFRIFQGEDCSGIYCDTMSELARRIGVKLRFFEAPSLRALAMMQFGKADIMLGPNRTAARERYLDYLDATFPPVRKAIFLRPDSPPIDGYADLDGRLVSMEAGKRYMSSLPGEPNYRIDLVADAATALRKLAAGRSDAAVMPELEGDLFIRQYGLALVKASYFIEGRPSYIVMSKKSANTDLEASIQRALGEMRGDGSLQRIAERYRATIKPF
jgi:polar amino acid transport system substrate-binding protein